MLQLPSLTALMAEYTTALDYTDALWKGLSEDEVSWRPHENASSIGSLILTTEALVAEKPEEDPLDPESED